MMFVNTSFAFGYLFFPVFLMLIYLQGEWKPLLFNLSFRLSQCKMSAKHSAGSSRFQLLQLLNEQEAHNDLWLRVYETEPNPPIRQPF